MMKRLGIISMALFTIGSIFAMRQSQEIRNQVKNPVTGQVIGNAADWVYKQDPETTQWTKLIPGCCAQWYQDGKRFLYFLDVGYDGSRSELWSADAAGEGRVRMTLSDYFISESPIVSTDRRKVAFHYHTSRAAGDFDDIVVIETKGFHEKADAKVVLRKQGDAKPTALRWLDDIMLEVRYGSEIHKIDTTKPGLPQIA